MALPGRGDSWATFKGKKPPWKIGYIDFPLVNASQVDSLSNFKRLMKVAQAKGLVSSVVTYIQPSMATATPEQQINAIQQMVREGVNGIIIHAINDQAEAPAIDAAGKAGVPIVTQLDIVPNSKYVVNLTAENFRSPRR